MSTMYKTSETEILEHGRFLSCFFTISTLNLLSETHTEGCFCRFGVFILKIFMGLKEMLVFMKQLYLLPGCKEWILKSHYHLSCRKGKVRHQPHPPCARGPWCLAEEMRWSLGTDSWEWMAMEEVKELVFPHTSLLSPFSRPSVALVPLLLVTAGVTLAVS